MTGWGWGGIFLMPQVASIIGALVAGGKVVPPQQTPKFTGHAVLAAGIFKSYNLHEYFGKSVGHVSKLEDVSKA